MKMPEEFYRTGHYETNHSTFGGLINFTDFCTDYRGKDEKRSPIAERIISDWKFDEECKKNRENNIRRNNYKKGMTA